MPIDLASNSPNINRESSLLNEDSENSQTPLPPPREQEAVPVWAMSGDNPALSPVYPSPEYEDSEGISYNYIFAKIK